MKSMKWIAPLLLLPLGAAVAYSQEGKTPEGKPTEASAGKTDDPMMAKWAEFATPGAEHKVLESRVGKWNLKVKCMMAPDAPAEESTATSEVTSIMEGRFVQEKVKGTMMGKPFEGMGMIGYDKLKKKYVSTWMSNCGTGLCTSEGTYDAGKKTFTFNGQQPDAMLTKYVPSRMTEQWTDNDHFVLQSFGPDKNGKEFMNMEIHGTRAK